MDAPQPDPETGMYKAGEDGKHEMREFTVSTALRDTTLMPASPIYHIQGRFLGIQAFPQAHVPRQVRAL
jgi:hypothetical protein